MITNIDDLRAEWGLKMEMIKLKLIESDSYLDHHIQFLKAIDAFFLVDPSEVTQEYQDITWMR